MTTTAILVLIAVVVILVAAGIYAIHEASKTPVAEADASGNAKFDTPTVPSSTVYVHCNNDGEPTLTGEQDSAETKTIKMSYKPLPSEACKTATGQDCQKKSWEANVHQDWKPDLQQTKDLKASDDKFHLVCPCACPTKILNLQWKDFYRNAYPNGELATYYNVRFKLTDPAGGKELATWTAWVRVAGGHTHYGDEGFKLIEIDALHCSTPEKIVECAKEKSGQQFAQPPAVPTS
ncbi:MAG: hypothetical protein ACRD5M_00390 [Candidatus Acidiferrales bacterium]